MSTPQQPQDPAQAQLQQQQPPASDAGAQQQQPDPSLVNTATKQIIGAALEKAQSLVQTPAPAGGATLDVQGVLARIQQLEQEKSEMKAQLETTKGRLDKLKEGKVQEMNKIYNDAILKWLEDHPSMAATAKEQLKDGLSQLVKDGNETAVWEVVANASAAHVANVNELETLRTKVSGYEEREKQLQGGIFSSEDSRMDRAAGEKRKAEEISLSTSSGPTNTDIWDEFHQMLQASGGNVGYDHSRGDTRNPGASIINELR